MPHAIRRFRDATLSGAVAAPFPGCIEFCHPELPEGPPSGQEWLHEIKLDGYRAELSIGSGAIKVYSRRAFDWAGGQFKPIARAAVFLRQRDCIVDGEVGYSINQSPFAIFRQPLPTAIPLRVSSLSDFL